MKAAAELRDEARAADGVGRALKSLAPVVVGELHSIVVLLMQAGRLRDSWEAALATARKQTATEDEALFAAAGALLIEFSKEAGKRIDAHGNDLLDRSNQLLGKAEAVEEMAAEVPPGDGG